jgi:membrane-associated phospholipid phosphatase
MLNQKSESLLGLFDQLPKNLIKIFSPKFLIWHFLAIILTVVSVFSGFDWRYYLFFHNTIFYRASFSAAIVGGLLPILLPLILFLIGRVKKNWQTVRIALTIGQAAILGSLISSFYKSLTGRNYPHFSSLDVSHVFRFGFFRGGIFWGWPSSHTMIAFAMAVSLMMLYPKNKSVRFWALVYAFFIGLGVSISIHWFSDFAAGAIIGTVIGIVVGKSFYQRPL